MEVAVPPYIIMAFVRSAFLSYALECRWIY